MQKKTVVYYRESVTILTLSGRDWSSKQEVGLHGDAFHAMQRSSKSVSVQPVLQANHVENPWGLSCGCVGVNKYVNNYPK